MEYLSENRYSGICWVKKCLEQSDHFSEDAWQQQEMLDGQDTLSTIFLAISKNQYIPYCTTIAKKIEIFRDDKAR